jgi:uroporphyrinogen decarboxylase
LMACLTAWHRDQQEMRAAYAKEGAVAATLIRECLELSVDAVIIADDLAGESALFFDVDVIQTLFAPFYTQAIAEIHGGHTYALFHSCGKIQQVIPHLIAWGFDGLAAIQHRANELISIKEQYGASLTVMAGIEGEMLAPRAMARADVEEYKRLVQALRLGGGFILCSSTGLYAGDFLERIQELYRIADEIVNR